jgi:type VI secretion system protein ImpA
MPLRNDLLNPIAGENPSGQNLRYAPVYDKIKEARREDDDAAQGDWKIERKTADWPFVVKTAGETLATKSKDLQVAAWLTEALLKTQGIVGLRDGLDLLKGLIEGFWDTLHPEIEDGDVEMRSAPLDWVGGRLDRAVKDAPLTRGGLSWFVYKDSRKVPTEEEAGGSSAKAETREAAVADGKVTPEEFDKSVDSSPKAYYVQLAADFDSAMESLQALDGLCEEKFQNAGPSFGPLRQTLEEVKQAVRIFLQKKREKEPDEPVEGEEPGPEAESTGWAGEEEAPAAQSAPARARKPGGALAAEPVDRDDAIARVVSAAKFMRAENQYDPAPYLLLRGLRWGELRAAGTEIDQALLAAPPSDIRQDLKRLAIEANWTEVLEAAEKGMGLECGRGWLDLQRYVGRACYELGDYYEPIRRAVISDVRGLLADYPQLPELTMMDDTPTANAETQAWLKENVAAAGAGAEAEYTPPAFESDAEAGSAAEPGAEAAPDTYYLAMQAARAGRPQEGIEMLMRDIAHENNGRARFHRRLQLTQLCISSGHEAVAVPILQALAAEIERHKLEDWESPELLAQPLALLYRCLGKDEGRAEERQKLYSWICRLDPLQAMNVSR